MRRRERFIFWSVALGVLLWLIQLVPLEWRYWAIAGFGLAVYFISALALREDLQLREWFVILPLPALYSLTIASFYFLLPSNFWSMIFVIGIFVLGAYSIFLTSNIFSVAKGRTIQLLNAAQTIALFFAIVISLLGSQIIFSFNLPFYFNALAIFALHLPLVLTIVWSVNLEEKISLKLWQLSFFSALLMGELAAVYSFLPMKTWNIALLLMSIFYLILGILQSYLREKLFRQAITEYVLLASFIFIMSVAFFPGK
ncbi:MAG: hypothetical protein Q4G02_02605 [bacterium]|nr:hypothetical protein [bacterium]